MYQFKIVLKPESSGGYLVSVPSLPGCVTFGETFDDAMQMAQDAITGCVAVMEQEGIDIVDDSMVYIESSIRIPSLLGRMSAASHLAYV